MMYTENEKAANELKSRILKTFETADKALQYKKDRQKQYSDLVNSLKKSRKESKEESRAFDIMKKNFKKDLGSSPASGTVQALMMPAFKPLLIKSASSMGSAPAMMMRPPKDTLKKIKRLRNQAASTIIHSIDTPNPNYGSIKEQYDVPSRYSKNRWLEHVKKCMAEHPQFTYKEALQKCKETYTKTTKTKKINL